MMPIQKQRLLDYKRIKADLLKAIKEIELIERKAKGKDPF